MIALETEKIFHHYVDLPLELQREIIDEMPSVERCRFRRCSTISDKEARSSKKFIYALKFERVCNRYICIKGVFKDNDDDHEMGFFLKFEIRYDKKYMMYQVIGSREKSKVELDNSVDLTLEAVKYFKNLLQCHQNSVQKLEIIARDVEINIAFELKNLRNLKELTVTESTDIAQIMTKTKRPLKNVRFWKIHFDRFSLSNCKQIYQVTDGFHIPLLTLNNEQFLQLSARDIEINIGELTPEDISNFIKLWKNGKTGNNLRSCIWNLRSSNFDTEQLYKICGMNHNEYDIFKVKVKHHMDHTKRAELSSHPRLKYLRFAVEN